VRDARLKKDARFRIKQREVDAEDHVAMKMSLRPKRGASRSMQEEAERPLRGMERMLSAARRLGARSPKEPQLLEGRAKEKTHRWGVTPMGWLGASTPM